MSPPSQPTPAPSVAAPKPEHHPPNPGPMSSRLPSLNQLAARININSNSPGTSASNASSPASALAGRPRLAASVLRTGSTTSLSTTVSNADSMVVNPPSTRSASPSGLSTPSRSNAATPSVPEGQVGDRLTSERLEKFNEETKATVIDNTEKPFKSIKGYKNIPSLDAITARLAKTRSLSIDGTAKPPEAEMIEDPKTPGVAVKAPEHPLQYTWTIYHDTKTKTPFTPATATGAEGFAASHAPESEDYEAGLTVIGEFDTVESFCRYFNWLNPPSKLERNSNYHLFKSGIKPMWEDEANAKGGKWVLTMKNNPTLLDRCWSFLAMALVGEEIEEGDEICGAVVSLRSKVDRIQLWTRSKDDVERLNAIGKKLVKLLDVSEADNIGLEFQYNTDDRPLPNKFLSISSMPSTSYRPTFAGHGQGKPYASPVTGPAESAPVPLGAFGNFGITNLPAGGAAPMWRGVKRT